MTFRATNRLSSGIQPPRMFALFVLRCADFVYSNNRTYTIYVLAFVESGKAHQIANRQILETTEHRAARVGAVRREHAVPGLTRIGAAAMVSGGVGNRFPLAPRFAADLGHVPAHLYYRRIQAKRGNHDANRRRSSGPRRCGRRDRSQRRQLRGHSSGHRSQASSRCWTGNS